MSDQPEEKPAEKAPGDPKPAKPKGRWWRRIRIALVAVIVLTVLLRAIVFFALAPVLHRVGRSLGLDITFERQELTLIGGDVGLWHLTAVPLSGGPAVFQTDYLRGNISVFELLKGRLLVRRAEADGVNLLIERDESGQFPLLNQLMHVGSTGGASTPAGPAKSTQPITLDFTSPLLVEALRMQHVRATFTDKSVKPEMRATVALSARVSDLGFLGRPSQFDLDVWCDPVLDSLRISGDLDNVGRHLVAAARVSMRGLHPKTLSPYLSQLGIKALAENIAADMSVKLLADPLPEPSKAVKASMSIEGISLTADEQPVASLGKIFIQADSADATATTLGQVLLERGRLNATRTADGLLQFAGLEIGAIPPNALPSPAKIEPQPTTAPAAHPFPYSLVIRDVTMRDMLTELEDQTASPAIPLKLHLLELISKGQDINPNDPQAVIPIAASIEAPGITQNIKADATLKPFGPEKSLELTFNADGIKPDALKPYLALAGVESMLKAAHAEGKLSAALRTAASGGLIADAHFTGLKLTDGANLASMQDINLHGAGIDPRTGRIKIESIELNGPTIDVTADPQGKVLAANLKISAPPKTKSTPAAGAPAATQTVAVPTLPRIEIGHFAWQGARLGLHDQQVQPASSVTIDNAGADVTNLVIDLNSTETSPPANVKFWLNAPQIARQFSAEGTITAGPKSLVAQIAVRGQGIQSALLAPYVKGLGIEPTLHDGSMQVDAKVSLTKRDDGLTASVGLTDARLSEGTQELGGVDALQVDDFAITTAALDLKSIHVAKPRVQVAREADGAFTALGIRIPKPVPATQPAAPAGESGPLTLPVVSLHELRVDDAQIGWTDRALPTPVQTVGHASVQLDGVVIGKTAPPATYRLVLGADGILDEMVISGSLTPSPESPTLTATVDGRGIRAGAIAAYLPPGIELATRDGRLRASIEAAIGNNPQGGNSAHLFIQDVNWRDGQDGSPLFAMESLRVIVPRIDLPKNVIAVDEISVAGLQTQARLEPQSIISAVGVTLRPVTAVAVETPASPPATAPAEDVNKLVADARKPLPLVTLEKFDIGIRRAAFLDMTKPESPTISLQDFHLKNVEPIRQGGPDAQSQPPVRLELSGQVLPVLGSFNIKTSATPFASEAVVTIDVAATGIRGSGLTDLLPELKEKIDGSHLTNGQFKTHVEMHARLEKRGPRDFDLSRPMQLDLAVEGTEFRGAPDGPVLAGLDGLHAEQAKLDPQTGSLLIRSIEIAMPSARASNEADGIHALGLIITPPTTAPATAPAKKPMETAAATTAPSKPSGEIRIDHLVVSGLDFRYEDHVANPIFILPLNGLEVEARDLSSLAMSEPRTMRFSALVNAGKVPITIQKSSGGGGVVGAIGGLANLAGKSTSAPTTREVVDRDFLSQIAVSGTMALYPAPRGHVQTSINGVELAALQGVAAEYGVTLRGGAFDSNIYANFRDDDVLDTRTRIVLTDLDVNELPNGPISRILKLPASLELIVLGLQRADGSINVPLDVQIKSSQVSSGALGTAAVGAMVPVFAAAAANAPLKAAKGAVDIVGLGGLFSSGKAAEVQPVELRFAPGSTQLAPDVQAQLKTLLDAARSDKNMQLTLRGELGGADVALAAERANPPAADCLAIAQRLRARKIELAQQRTVLASQARAEVASMPAGQLGGAVVQLRAMDQQIGEVEQSLDQVYELLRPGAERQAARRTRAAALNVAQLRLDAVGAMLKSSNLPDAASRVNAVGAQFNPTQAPEGGKVIIMPVVKK